MRTKTGRGRITLSDVVANPHRMRTLGQLAINPGMALLPQTRMLFIRLGLCVPIGPRPGPVFGERPKFNPRRHEVTDLGHQVLLDNPPREVEVTKRDIPTPVSVSARRRR